ncbi:serine/threonine protein kinase, partial [Plesiocystis pacifica SIR-1]
MPEPSNRLSPRTRPSRARGEADDAGETVDAAPGDGSGALGSTLDANPGADPDAEAEPAPGASLDFVDGGPPAGYDSQETLEAPPESTIEGIELMGSPPRRVGPGATLGGYRIDRRLGAGGMGEVFLAQRLSDQRRFALKVLSQTHAARLYRFKREFRALADVRHDNLVALEELVVMPDGRAFFTMEVVEGVAFVDYVRQGVGNGQLPNLVRLNRALRQLITGVRHLHRAGFVHRDLKPSNVLITREGRVVILDFGLISELAQPSHPSSDEGMTRDGQIMGTPAYMAPEQAGEANHGPPVDYYAVGVMLFECLTGTLPFRGQILDILIDKRHGSVPSLRERLHESAPSSKTFEALEDLCRRALSPAPGERPKAEAWLAALGVAGSPSPASASAPRAASGNQAPFVGREAELAVLRDALATIRSRLEPVAVHIRGDSGLGKSALVLRFLDQARAEAPGLAVLRGRCLERESVPYKGIDAVVDALAVY